MYQSTEIEYDGMIPKTLRDYCDKHPDKIAYVGYGGGYASASGYAYDVTLRYGWKDDAGAHTIIGDTIRDTLSRLRYSVFPCTCDECKAGLAENAR